tara:strand:- start:8821 stop:9489 length:669 start_codon:yes stop_codon:yes gene_type:complete
MFKLLIQSALFVLPWMLRRRALKVIFGFEIASSASIGFSLLGVDNCEIGENARIGHLTMVKGLSLLRIEDHGILGNLNWVTGFPKSSKMHFSEDTSRDPCLWIEQHAAITNRHLVDCTDRVTIGKFSTVGGFRSQLLSHSIDLSTNRQSCRPITVGAYCFVGTGSVLLKGSALPDYSVLGAGSVLTKVMSEPGKLYSGVPAELVRSIDYTSGYFVRKTGFVH